MSTNGESGGDRRAPRGEIRYYEPTQEFGGKIGATATESEPAWPSAQTAAAGSPNILFIVLDDVGFAQLGCYGGLGGRIETPNVDRLARAGLRYTNWHTTGLCSPTRACLLTGRNHHTVGVGVIMELATGYPGYNAQIPHEAAMLPAVLVERGYNTMCLGKWHLAPDEHITASGPYDRWPLGRGFERFYGFLPGETDQWQPALWYDNHRVEPPRTPEQGYHLTEDLVDRAVEWITEQKAVTPDKPFFMYLATGAVHSPHQVHASYVEKYHGRFDAGWDVIREETLAAQKRLGVVPVDTELPPRNPGVKAWDSLSKLERSVLCRQMETFAGFLTHTDEQIGRLLAFLERAGQLENTLAIVVSDNGASGEGGPIGLCSEMSAFNMVPESIEDLARALPRWGGPGTHPHYATGWAMAGNTPQRWYKQQVHEGGTRDPLIVSWPARIRATGEVRRQFHHAVDVMPTILDAIGIDMPDIVRGYDQIPLEGVSMAYSFDDGAAPTQKDAQYFEMLGHRALWEDGYKAVAFHHSKAAARLYGLPAPERDNDFDADSWELYHLDDDFSECHDLARLEPERLKRMVQIWWHEAEEHQVLPLDDTGPERMVVPKPVVFEERDVYVFHSPVKLVRSGSPDLKGRSYTVTAEVEIPPDGAEGVIVSNGGSDGGWVLGVKDDKVHYVSSYLGREFFTVSSKTPIPRGRVTVRFEFKKSGPLCGVGSLHVDGRKVGEAHIKRTNPVVFAVTEGLEIGSDGTAPVWPGVRSPYTFTGTIHKVELRLGTDKIENGEAQADLAMYRQ